MEARTAFRLKSLLKILRPAKQATLRDVHLVLALKRILGENGGRADMFRLIYKASNSGENLLKKERWYEKSIWKFLSIVFSMISVVVAAAIAYKIYFVQ